MTKAKWIVIAWVGMLVVLDLWVWRKQQDAVPESNMPIYTESTLAKYDGSTDEPVLLALDGLVYDVTPGRVDFYNPGESYHYLVGKDASGWLHIYGAGLIKEKYKVVGVYQP